MKYYQHAMKVRMKRSHPARGAWIEIGGGRDDKEDFSVAPRKGCVD